jgi:hypothetical protein
MAQRGIGITEVLKNLSEFLKPVTTCLPIIHYFRNEEISVYVETGQI